MQMWLCCIYIIPCMLVFNHKHFTSIKFKQKWKMPYYPPWSTVSPLLPSSGILLYCVAVFSMATHEITLPSGNTWRPPFVYDIHYLYFMYTDLFANETEFLYSMYPLNWPLLMMHASTPSMNSNLPSLIWLYHHTVLQSNYNHFQLALVNKNIER